MKTFLATCGLVLLFVLSANRRVCDAQQPAPPNGPQGGAARGGRRGGPPITAAEQAELAPLAELPAWKPGAGDGNYSIGPDYAPAPEITPREGVPVGKVESFTLQAADSKFYPPTGLRGANPTRKVTVYIPAQYKPGAAAPFIVSCDA